MGFITKFSKKYNFHYTKVIGTPEKEEYLEEISRIIKHKDFIKNMNTIWDLRYCNFPENYNKFSSLLEFIESAKKSSPIKGDNYKTVILVDTLEKYTNLSDYIILAKENKVNFEVNIFTDLYETLLWFKIDKSHHKEILNFLLND